MGACCDIDYEQLLTYLDGILNRKIMCGELQGGLLSCSASLGECTPILPKGTGVVTCAELAGLVERLINEGAIEIPGIKDFKLEGDTLELTDQADKVWRVPLTELLKGIIKSVRLEGHKLIMTKNDDSVFEVDLDPLVKDAQVKAAAIDADGNLVITLGDGKEIVVDMARAGHRITAMALDLGYNLVVTFGDGTQRTVDLKPLLPVVVESGGPITGNGTVEDPLAWDPTKLCLHLIESAKFTEQGLEIYFEDQCEPLIVPFSTIVAQLHCKVRVCVTANSGITGDGTDTNPLGFDLNAIPAPSIDALAEKLRCKVAVCATYPLTGNGQSGTPLDVARDPRPDNLLRLSAAGLYVVLEAPADLSNQYVSLSLGDDINGTGTQASPFRTVNKALSRIPATPGLFNIMLRSGEEHLLGSPATLTGWGSTQITQIQFVTYDEPVYQRPELGPLNAACPSWIPYCGEEYQRATLRCNFGRHGPTNQFIGYNSVTAQTIRCSGINVVFDPVPSIPGVVQTAQSPLIGEIYFSGCTLSVHDRFAMTGEKYTFQTSRIDALSWPAGPNLGRLILNYSGTEVVAIFDPGNTDACGIAGLPTYTALLNTFPKGINLANFVTTPAYDLATKTSFNFRTTWDIFATPIPPNTDLP